MAALPYMQLYVADYLADTAHLTAAQHGAYLLLMFNYWQRGKPLNNFNERLTNVARMSNEEWLAAKPALEEFFEIDGDEWIHARIDRDLAAVNSKSGKASEAGKASAAKRAEKRLADVKRTFNHTDVDVDTDTDTDKTKAKRSPRFNPADCVLPPSIDSEKWAEWIAYRKGRKLATSEATALKQIEFLADCAGKGIDAGKVIDDSIRQGWQGLFEPKQQQASKPGYQSIHEQRANTIAILTGKKSHERTIADERDITGESCRVAG